MSTLGKALIAGVMLVAPSIGLVSVAEALPPIRIGVSFTQTGSLAAFGQNIDRGYQLCVKHANDKGGVLGRRIELRGEDNRSDGATAAAIYEKFITRDKVDAILSPYSSPLTEAVADVIERHRKVFHRGRRPGLVTRTSTVNTPIPSPL